MSLSSPGDITKEVGASKRLHSQQLQPLSPRKGGKWLNKMSITLVTPGVVFVMGLADSEEIVNTLMYFLLN